MVDTCVTFIKIQSFILEERLVSFLYYTAFSSFIMPQIFFLIPIFLLFRHCQLFFTIRRHCHNFTLWMSDNCNRLGNSIQRRRRRRRRGGSGVGDGRGGDDRFSLNELLFDLSGGGGGNNQDSELSQSLLSAGSSNRRED